MTYEEINAIVGKGIARVSITLPSGKKVTKRLFISTNSEHFVCECMKRSTTKGYVIRRTEYESWVSMRKVSDNVDLVKRMKKRALRALDMLSESGLWSDIKKEIEEFLKLSNEDIKSDFVDKGVYSLYQSKKYGWFKTYQIFGEFLKEKCWKTPSFDKWDTSKQLTLTNVQNAIEFKRNFSTYWRNGYDNTLSIEIDSNGNARGYYSEEFKGCGNGHYYLLFDYKHAIFYEDD